MIKTLLKTILVCLLGGRIVLGVEEEVLQVSDKAADIDRLGIFYQRIAQSDAIHCKDRTRLLPDCRECIPGLEQSSGSTSCDQYIPSSRAIRDEIRKLVVQRFGAHQPANRSFGLYPYLEKAEFLRRHFTFGQMLSSKNIVNLIDVGAYYNPVHLFLGQGVCPDNVLIIEPILDALSVQIPCQTSSGGKKMTHVIFLPITFKHYMTVKESLPRIETVVCIGCDSHYGPSRYMLETAFKRPYALYLEYPHDYVHNAPYRKMNGNGPGETLIYVSKFQAKTNETIYTKRVMKVIDYKQV